MHSKTWLEMLCLAYRALLQSGKVARQLSKDPNLSLIAFVGLDSTGMRMHACGVRLELIVRVEG